MSTPPNNSALSSSPARTIRIDVAHAHPHTSRSGSDDRDRDRDRRGRRGGGGGGGGYAPKTKGAEFALDKVHAISGFPPRREREREDPLVERPAATMAMNASMMQPKKVIRVLARGEKLEP